MLPTSTSKADEVSKASFKNILQDALEAKLDGHLKYQKYQEKKPINSSKGSLLKTIKGILGIMNLNVPRDRDTSFQPRILAQQKRTLELKRMAISLYAIGSSTRGVITIIEELDGFDMDPSYLSKNTKQLWPKIEEFKTRRFDKIYPMILLDGIRFKTREERILQNVSI